MSLRRGMAVGKAVTCVPDFDGLVEGTRDDGLSVGGEIDGGDAVAVGVILLCLELQSVCGGRKSEFAQRHGSWKSGHLRSKL